VFPELELKNAEDIEEIIDVNAKEIGFYNPRCC
jgi:hypothetical protein